MRLALLAPALHAQRLAPCALASVLYVCTACLPMRGLRLRAHHGSAWCQLHASFMQVHLPAVTSAAAFSYMMVPVPIVVPLMLICAWPQDVRHARDCGDDDDWLYTPHARTLKPGHPEFVQRMMVRHGRSWLSWVAPDSCSGIFRYMFYCLKD